MMYLLLLLQLTLTKSVLAPAFLVDPIRMKYGDGNIIFEEPYGDSTRITIINEAGDANKRELWLKRGYGKYEFQSFGDLAMRGYMVHILDENQMKFIEINSRTGQIKEHISKLPIDPIRFLPLKNNSFLLFELNPKFNTYLRYGSLDERLRTVPMKKELMSYFRAHAFKTDGILIGNDKRYFYIVRREPKMLIINAELNAVEDLEFFPSETKWVPGQEGILFPPEVNPMALKDGVICGDYIYLNLIGQHIGEKRKFREDELYRFNFDGKFLGSAKLRRSISLLSAYENKMVTLSADFKHIDSYSCE